MTISAVITTVLSSIKEKTSNVNNSPKMPILNHLEQNLIYQGTILETLLCQYVKLYYVNRCFFTPVIVIQIPILSPNM